MGYFQVNIMSLKTAEWPLLDLFRKFITDSKKGKRLQPNGKRFADGTLQNYGYTYKLLEAFSRDKSFRLRIRIARKMNMRELAAEKNYWKKFYKHFTGYLYNECGYFDNYVGQNIRIIKTFLNYVNKELLPGSGNLQTSFYVRNEEILIHPILPEQLNYLIYDSQFEASLQPRLREVKDVFVFGCTVALRVSDLLSLKKSNLRQMGEGMYIIVRSKKTATDTLVRLPDYAVAILKKYKRQRSKLLPHFNKVNLNKYIKQLLEQAGFTQPITKSRSIRGVSKECKRMGKSDMTYRFCDLASTHTMRRTAITTMLSLGMPEQVVRKISGHAPGSKEFYKYVKWAQAFQDEEAKKMFMKLEALRATNPIQFQLGLAN